MDTPRGPESSPTAFFALTFVLSTPLYILNSLAFSSLLGSPEIGPVYIALLTFTPGLAAVLLTLRRRGKEPVKTLLSRVFDFDRIKQKGWYIAVFLLGPLIFALTAGCMLLLGAPSQTALLPVVALPAVFAFCVLLAAAADNTALMLVPAFKSIVPFGSVVQCGHTLFAAILVAFLWDSSTMTRFRFGAHAKPSVG